MAGNRWELNENDQELAHFVQKCVKQCAFLYSTQLVGNGEYRIQETEDGSQKAEGGGQKTDGRQYGLKAILSSLRGLTTNSTNSHEEGEGYPGNRGPGCGYQDAGAPGRRETEGGGGV